MKKKFRLTVLLACLWILSFMCLDLVTYKVSQEYSYVAVEQLEDSAAAYDAMNTQSGVSSIVLGTRAILSLALLWFTFSVWREKIK